VRFLVFQHIAAEHPGIFRKFMRRDGVEWDVVELDENEPIPDLECYDALLVFGGPMDVWQEEKHPWLVPEKAAIRTFVREMHRPFLGVCLGHQLLADALGGKVGLMAQPEVGVAELRLTPAGHADRLFRGMQEPMRCVQWHGAEVKTLPEHAVVLVHNEACPVQAFRVYEHAYGLQYHVETEDQTIAEWGCIPTYRRALEAIKGPHGQEEFERDTTRHIASFRDTAANLYSRFRALTAASVG
jgi:GMP synthase-like glutamine amidotransferase